MKYSVTKNYNECDDFCYTVCFFKDREVQQVSKTSNDYDIQLQQIEQADELLYYVFDEIVESDATAIKFLQDLHSSHDYKSMTVCADKEYMN